MLCSSCMEECFNLAEILSTKWIEFLQGSFLGLKLVSSDESEKSSVVFIYFKGKKAFQF